MHFHLQKFEYFLYLSRPSLTCDFFSLPCLTQYLCNRDRKEGHKHSYHLCVRSSKTVFQKWVCGLRLTDATALSSLAAAAPRPPTPAQSCSPPLWRRCHRFSFRVMTQYSVAVVTLIFNALPAVKLCCHCVTPVLMRTRSPVAVGRLSPVVPLVPGEGLHSWSLAAQACVASSFPSLGLGKPLLLLPN